LPRRIVHPDCGAAFCLRLRLRQCSPLSLGMSRRSPTIEHCPQKLTADATSSPVGVPLDIGTVEFAMNLM
jgi:hypothetical protein